MNNHIVLLNENQAAERLGLKVKTLQAWRQQGKGPAFIKLGRSVRYNHADLVAFLESNRRTSTSTPDTTAAG